MLTTNHYIKIGEVIESQGKQVALADEHQVWVSDRIDSRYGSYKTVGKATIRISSTCENSINTNFMNSRGVVCILPNEFQGCAIIKVKITRVRNKSVEAIPIEYVQSDKPFDWFCYGMELAKLLEETIEYPNIKHVIKA